MDSEMRIAKVLELLSHLEDKEKGKWLAKDKKMVSEIRSILECSAALESHRLEEIDKIRKLEEAEEADARAKKSIGPKSNHPPSNSSGVGHHADDVAPNLSVARQPEHEAEFPSNNAPKEALVKPSTTDGKVGSTAVSSQQPSQGKWLWTAAVAAGATIAAVFSFAPG